MNALRIRPVMQQVARQQRTKATMASKAFPQRKQSDFKKDWLSDPSTYPIIAVMGGGLIFMCGMTLNALFTYKQGIDISPNQRGRIMKQYSDDYRVGLMERFVTMRGGINPEGLGVDHEKRCQEREAYLKK
jgi:hypothetical protein